MENFSKIIFIEIFHSFSDFYYMFLPTEKELANLTESKML